MSKKHKNPEITCDVPEMPAPGARENGTWVGDRVYISGPITSVGVAHATANFARAERRLRRQGYRVMNPTRFAVCRWPWLYRLLGYRLTLLYDLWSLLRCTVIYMLADWQQSPGARTEYSLAKALNLPVLFELTRSEMVKRRNGDKEKGAGC